MTSTMEQWRNRTALVTGGSAGIGAAVARRLVECGMRVATCARRLDRLEELKQELGASSGELWPFPVNLRNEPDILAMFDAIRRNWGGVDVVVNNAGLGHKAPLVSGETAKWREMLDVNVLALCICTREAIKDMQRQNVAGHVLHISSMAGHRVPPDSGVYAATKYAVRGLTEALRQELRAAGSPIRVTAISPGFVETEFAEIYHQSAAVAREIHGSLKVLEANDLAEAVVYVLSQPAHVQVHDILLRPTEQRN